MLRQIQSAWIETKRDSNSDELPGTAAVYKLTITTQRSTSVGFEIVFSATGEQDDDTVPLYNSLEQAHNYLRRLKYRRVS